MDDVQQGPAETAEEKMKYMHKVLRAYAKDIRKYGKPLDSGLPNVLDFVAEQIEKK